MCGAAKSIIFQQKRRAVWSTTQERNGKGDGSGFSKRGRSGFGRSWFRKRGSSGFSMSGFSRSGVSRRGRRPGNCWTRSGFNRR